MKDRVLGTRVDVVSRNEALEVITDWIESSTEPKLVSTAYSEFFVTARCDEDFRMALEGSDLVTPDGIGPLAAIRYKFLIAHCSLLICKLAAGLRTGVDILRGRVGETVSGYWLFQNLMEKAAENGWKVFLLGGFGETAEKLTLNLSNKYKGLSIKYDKGAQNKREMDDAVNDRVIQKVNNFKPDLLFVAYGPVKQEKWLKANKSKLKVKVAMGVGGTFDEALGKVKEAPVAFERMGLKWLWRLIQQPRRMGRIWKAVIVFPWIVFREKTD